MKRFFIILRILLIIFPLLINFQCSWPDEEDEQCNDYKPSDCNEERPKTGIVNVVVTINELNSYVSITLYEGDVENNRIELKDTLHTNTKSYRLGNSYYSVKAIYKAEIAGEIVTVSSINGGWLEYDSDKYCDGTCYTEGEITINVDM